MVSLEESRPRTFTECPRDVDGGRGPFSDTPKCSSTRADGKGPGSVSPGVSLCFRSREEAASLDSRAFQRWPWLEEAGGTILLGAALFMILGETHVYSGPPPHCKLLTNPGLVEGHPPKLGADEAQL